MPPKQRYRAAELPAAWTSSVPVFPQPAGPPASAHPVVCACQPSCTRVFTSALSIGSLTRRSTVRRLMPNWRAIVSSVAPASISASTRRCPPGGHSSRPGSSTAFSAGACGFYRLGGEVPHRFPSAGFGLLPSWGQCGTPDVPWVKSQAQQITVPAHGSVNVTLTLDTTVLSQPGDFAAQVTLDPSGTPYTVTPSPVTLHATPPARWSQVTGTVTLKPCIGAAGPADHASVEIGSGAGGAAVRTDVNGHYSYWAGWPSVTLPLLFAKNGYLIQQHAAELRAGGTATVNVTLTPIRSCTCVRMERGHKPRSPSSRGVSSRRSKRSRPRRA